MSDPSAPRLWVETDAEGHQAAMLTIYPAFDDVEPYAAADLEFVLVLDLSSSMAQGDAFKDLQCAAYQVLRDVLEWPYTA